MVEDWSWLKKALLYISLGAILPFIVIFIGIYIVFWIGTIIWIGSYIIINSGISFNRGRGKHSSNGR
jgi:hypothetical protein